MKAKIAEALMNEDYRLGEVWCAWNDEGEEVYVDSSEYNTGFWVAKYIADNKVGYEQIILHTLNFSGAVLMLNLLKMLDISHTLSW